MAGTDHTFDVVVVGGGPRLEFLLPLPLLDWVRGHCWSSEAMSSEATPAMRSFIRSAGSTSLHRIGRLSMRTRASPSSLRRCFSGVVLRLPRSVSGGVHVLPTYPHLMRAAALEMCSQVKGLAVWRTSELIAATVRDSGIDLRIRGPEGESTVRAPIAIDTSGDANLAAAVSAACELEQPDRLQNPSFIVRIRGVDPRETEGFARMRLTHAVARAERESKLPLGAGSVLLRPGPVAGEAYLTLNVAKPDDETYAPLDDGLLGRLTDGARATADAVVAFLRESRAGFGSCEVVEWPRSIGVRETRRVAGMERVESSDLLAGCRRGDEVALSTWPIEIWKDHRGARFEYPQGPSSITLGALISRDCSRLGMAGRCMSASHRALGALRVIGTAMATGQAIGIAAAESVDHGVDLITTLRTRNGEV